MLLIYSYNSQALLGEQEDLFDEVLGSAVKYLLVVLKSGTTREQLEAVAPNFPGKPLTSLLILFSYICSTHRLLRTSIIIITRSPGSQSKRHSRRHSHLCRQANLEEA